MRQTVYIDLYFVINFIVDWFILMVAADLLRVNRLGGGFRLVQS